MFVMQRQSESSVFESLYNSFESEKGKFKRIVDDMTQKAATSSMNTSPCCNRAMTLSQRLVKQRSSTLKQRRLKKLGMCSVDN